MNERRSMAGASRGLRGLARLGAGALGACLVGAPLLGTSLSGCGARSALPVPDPESDTADGAACQGMSIPVLPNVPNLYFVLDASGSMLNPPANPKWGSVRAAVAGLIGEIGPNARFGATVFPPPLGGTCAAGVEVMPLTLGDTQGAAVRVFAAATSLTPQGGTPTAATFQSLLPKFRNTTGITSIILATDGGPNCDAAAFAPACNPGPCCAIDQCTSNTDGITNNLGQQVCFATGPMNCCQGAADGCLDGNATALAIANLRAIGVQTYVMGIPGSAPYGPVLDQMAIAGGTARQGEPRYYQVTSTDTGALSTALAEIERQAMKSCSFTLGESPADPSKVNVYLDGAVVPSDGPDGWTQHGTTVVLEGSSCAVIQGDSAPPNVQVTGGCPTVHAD